MKIKLFSSLLKRTGLILTILLLGINSILSGCQTEIDSISDELTAQIVITRNNGNELILDEAVTISPGESVLDALEATAEVEFAYGGAFISGINGFTSGFSEGQQMDWFIYVNGIHTRVGAADYRLATGDVAHFDFHSWGFRQFVPATVGEFPEPFLHGYAGKVYPTVIAYQDGYQQDAILLVSALESFGVSDVSAKTTDKLTTGEKKSANLVLLGTYDCPLIAEINDIWQEMGFYCRYQDEELKIYGQDGELAGSYRTAASVQASQNPYNPKGIGICENVLWVLAGTDENAVHAACDVLLNKADDYRYATGIAVVNGDVFRVAGD